MAYQPIILLGEGGQRTRGRDAHWMNIAAGDLGADDEAVEEDVDF